ncbi:MAG: iron-sulfur cluster assembly protein [Sulfitobacter sp.]
MEPAELADPKLADVWARLDRVMDPELDEPITDMGFVEQVLIENKADVTVMFRLPTYWCSPNFAFLMAQGIKREVDALPWVNSSNVWLEDHMAAEEMNAAVNAGGSFADAFSELQGGEDLDALREKFDRKAFQRRQEVVIKALVSEGRSVEAILATSLGDLLEHTFDDAENLRQAGRYLDLLQSKRLATIPDDPAFPTYEGTQITGQGFKSYMDLLRSVRINMEFSGSLCRGLKRSRYKEANLSGDGPTLVDFIIEANTAAGRDGQAPNT